VGKFRIGSYSRPLFHIGYSHGKLCTLKIGQVWSVLLRFKDWSSSLPNYSVSLISHAFIFSNSITSIVLYGILSHI
jgi:hypothetical protein